MESEIYRKITDCLEEIRMILKISQIEFASYLLLTREGYRLMIGLDTNKKKKYVKIDLIHILSSLVFNCENYEIWKQNKKEIAYCIKKCFIRYYQRIIRSE